MYMGNRKKPFSPNDFLILFTVVAGLFFLILVVVNIKKKQEIKSRAAANIGCNSTMDCPSGTTCLGGACRITSPTVTQAPLAYVDVNTIIEPPKTIPAVYQVPTPTPEPNILLVMSKNINGFVGSAVKSVGILLNWLGKQALGFWLQGSVDSE